MHHFHGMGYGSTSGGGAGAGLGIGAAIVASLAGGYVVSRVRRSKPAGAPRASVAAAEPVSISPSFSQARVAETKSGALAELRESDPDFEPETFLQRAEMTYFLVNRAYRHRDAAALRPYLAPELSTQWSARIDALVAAHRVPAQLDLNVRGMHVPDVRHGPDGDAITVHFDIVCREREIDDRGGNVVSDSGADVRSGEDWTFARKAGVKTIAAGGTTASKCPACGAPLQLDVSGRCARCRSAVDSGEHDWIVATIAKSAYSGLAPDAFFGARRVDAAAGFNAIAAADPAFSTAAFLERCSAAFLALEGAWQARDLSSVRGFMSPGLYYAWQTQIEQLEEARRKNVLEHLKLDAITPMTVLHGGAYDDVTVRIDATCADYEIDETSGHIVFGSRTPSSFCEYWTFQRGAAVASNDRPGTFEKHCPNCGASLDINAIGECRYCNAAVTSGKFDWVLSRIEQA